MESIRNWESRAVGIMLDGGEIDTLFKLVEHGPQQDGDLPSKSGIIGLIQKGLAKKDYSKDLPNRATTLGIDTWNALAKEPTK
jgi:hypothetical protein